MTKTTIKIHNTNPKRIIIISKVITDFNSNTKGYILNASIDKKNPSYLNRFKIEANQTYYNCVNQ
ncbi:hypothetical protein HanXRQr2_Chr04g0148881 [Helianthus annuus]|uniref:Uncharacterized protein n=1 Tax=Helianthus annuus TaxID=4232 RepID=A0A9K3J5B3_HELAN|nr:hypothetical protein HanXRQr2_Chr04g0148881 [Helianthus annuus]